MTFTATAVGYHLGKGETNGNFPTHARIVTDTMIIGLQEVIRLQTNGSIMAFTFVLSSLVSLLYLSKQVICRSDEEVSFWRKIQNKGEISCACQVIKSHSIHCHTVGGR